MKSVIFALLLISTSIHAAENTKHEKLMELMNVMDMDSMVDTMYSQMDVMMQSMSAEMGVKPSEQVIFDEYYRKMTLVLREEISWAKMLPTTIDIYDRNFSEAEISDMLAFYKTTTGKTILAKMPLVMQESMEMGQSLARNAIPRVQEIAKQLAEDLERSRNSQE